jgi:VWFA-related protein
MRCRIGVALGLLALSAHSLLGQQPTFRAGVELVEIDAVVTDAGGDPVTGLTADDFELREDGTPHPIAAFSTVEIPIERAERPLFSPTAVEPDVRSNQGGAGRIYLFVLDEVSPTLALRTRHFLRTFVEQHLGANDIAGIAYIGRGASNSQDFTSNKRILLGALDRFAGGFPSEPAPQAATAIPQGTDGSGLPPANPFVSEAEFELRGRMKAFRNVTEFLAQVEGRRKAMLLITTGAGVVDMQNIVDYNGGTMSIATADAHAALQAAARGNVAVYPIDPRGLALGDALDGGNGPSADIESLQQAARTGLANRDSLHAMANATGGFAFVNQNTFSDAFARIVRENSVYYVLGYYPTNERRNGRFRRVQLRVKRPGLQVRSRSGYLAPSGRAPAPPPETTSTLAPALRDAFRSATARPGVPMKLFAAPYKGADRTASVVLVVEVDPSALDLVEKDGVFSGQLEVATAALSSAGKTVGGERHVVALALKPETFERATRDGFRLLSELRLAPGKYQIRAAAGDRAARAGSVVADLEVPDFTKGPLVMSGVSLTSSGAAATPTARPKDPLRDLLPGPPTTTRVFSPDETITLFAEVYDNQRSGARHTVDLKATLRADDGRAVQTVAETRSSSELQGSSGGYGFKAELPLEGAAPGLYVIHVEARANTGDLPRVSRDVQIAIK